MCTIEDEKVSVDSDLVERIQDDFADHVRLFIFQKYSYFEFRFKVWTSSRSTRSNTNFSSVFVEKIKLWLLFVLIKSCYIKVYFIVCSKQKHTGLCEFSVTI